jgi:hypothetical protein
MQLLAQLTVTSPLRSVIANGEESAHDGRNLERSIRETATTSAAWQLQAAVLLTTHREPCSLTRS